MKVAAAFALMILLSGCSLTLPVKGQVEYLDETFSGTATGYMTLIGAPKGKLQIVSNQGVVCTGDFVYLNITPPLSGEGGFTCNDGRSGPFVFESPNGQYGVGFGELGGQKFTFTFGE